MLWDVSKCEQRKRVELPNKTKAYTVCFSPDGKSLITGDSNANVRIWDTATLQEKGLLEGHTRQIHSVCYSPDGKLIASAGWDKTIRLWDAQTEREKSVLKGHKVKAYYFNSI